MAISRDDVHFQYSVRNGIIESYNKFVGEKIYMPHIYDLILDLNLKPIKHDKSAFINSQFYCVKLTQADKDEYPELSDKTEVLFFIDYNGYVHEYIDPSEFN